MQAHLVLPIVHLNGTSRERLIEQLCDAGGAVIAAIEALAQTAPNGRDYYPVPGLLARAEEQHRRRIAGLVALHDELATEAEALEAGS